MTPSGPAILAAGRVAQHQSGHRRTEHRVLALDGDARRRRVHDVQAVGCRHHDPLREQARGHTDLLARELPVGRRRGRRRGGVTDRLGERGGDDPGAGSHTLQRVERVELHQRGRGESHHRERGDRRRGATDLLEHDARLEEPESRAAGRLGDRDAHDPGIGKCGPQVPVEAVVVGEHALHAFEPGGVGEDLGHEIAEILLVGGEGEIHQRSALGRPSVNWEIRSRCISLTPPPKVRMIEPRVPTCRRERSTAPGASGSR